MGTCVHCGENAGFLKKVHQECQARYDAGVSHMLALATDTAQSGQGLDTLQQQMGQIASTSRVPQPQVHETLVRAFEVVLDRYLEDHVLSAEEEERLNGFIQHAGLSQVALDRSGAYTRLVMAATLRDLLEGNVPSRFKIDGVLPFNLQKSESLLWMFQHVGYFEEKVQRTFVGASRGVSIRLAKGVYYRVGQSKGQAIETSQLEFVEHGLLGVTTKHLYFSGTRKSFRIPFTKMVSIQPYADGISVHRDAANAKPQVFAVPESWFLYNLVMNLSQV